MGKEEKTEWGFTRGKVAKQLRQILHNDFDDNAVETIADILLCHLLIERSLNTIIYGLLEYDLPLYGGKDIEKENNKINESMKDRVWTTVRQMAFLRKLEMIDPALKIWFNHLPGKIREINSVRNDVFHGRKNKNDVTFENKSIWQEDGLERYFIVSQLCTEELNKFYDMLDDNRAVREKWGRRLSDLGEPLM